MKLLEMKATALKKIIFDLLVEEQSPVSITEENDHVKAQFITENQKIRYCIYGLSVEKKGDNISVKDMSGSMDTYTEVTNRYFLVSVIENLLLRRYDFGHDIKLIIKNDRIDRTRERVKRRNKQI